MRIVLSGASGFLGTTLARQLRAAGHDVVRLVRGDAAEPDQRSWDPANGGLDPAHLDGADTILNLGGAPIEHWPWTESYKDTILHSRLQTTGTLARTMAALDSSPALVNASGINYYGSDRGDEQVDEYSAAGDGFLADVCRQWEQATEPASAAGSRVVMMRTSLVLHRSGGVLKLIKIPFLAGVGGRLGSGRQFFPSISLTDYIAAAIRLATDPGLSGPFNLVAPVPATNADFTQALGRRLHRPTVVPVPGFALRTAVGELANEMLGSLNAVPTRLTAAGFEFRHPTIDDQVDAAFSEQDGAS